MRVVLDETRCSSLGMCESVAPAFFEVGDDGALTVLRTEAGVESSSSNTSDRSPSYSSATPKAAITGASIASRHTADMPDAVHEPTHPGCCPTCREDRP